MLKRVFTVLMFSVLLMGVLDIQVSEATDRGQIAFTVGDMTPAPAIEFLAPATAVQLQDSGLLMNLEICADTPFEGPAFRTPVNHYEQRYLEPRSGGEKHQDPDLLTQHKDSFNTAEAVRLPMLC